MDGTGLRNNKQVREYLLGKDKLVKVVDYILDKIYKKNIDVVNRVVYASYDPSAYQRTYGFREAWDVKGAKAAVTHVRGSFEYSPNKMNVNPELAQHASPEPPYGDSREYLADIIYRGMSGMLFGNGPWRKSRDAWSALIRELGADTLATWAEEGFKSVGLTVEFNTFAGMGIKNG